VIGSAGRRLTSRCTARGFASFPDNRRVRLGVEAALVDGVIHPGDVEIADGRIARVGLSGRGRGIAVPGFVDLHVHGFGGVDFAGADTDGYRRAGAALIATGVTAFNPTFVTAPVDELVTSVQAMPNVGIGPRILGAHLEGPFISAERLGMHPLADRRDPDRATVARLLDAGRVTHVTLAPELAGAGELIDELVARGIVAACGHTDANADEAHAAFDRGATHVTHLFNAMRPFGHREPGLVGAALTRADVSVELILDGNHLAPESVEIAWRAAAGRVVLVTDAMAAAGVGNGRWRLGRVEVDVRDSVVRRQDNGVLAGTVLTLPVAIRDLMRAGASFAHAVDAATRVPARVAGRSDVGTLAPGARADVVVLDGDVEVVRVLVDGIEH
jgi:N-acetylglucosamine-6-phosphate deacetylase